METGGNVATAGGATAAVGGASETAATVMDKAAEMVISGQTPELLAPAVELAERLLGGLILKRIPGAGAVAGKGKKDAKKKAPEKKGGGNERTGGYNLGVGGPCIVGTYEQIKGNCAEGQQAHHIVPDTLNRTGNRAQGAKGVGRIPGMPSFGSGPAICLQGNAGTKGSEHNTAHQADSGIHEAAQRTDNGPPGTLPVSEAVPKTMSVAIAVRPDCKEQIEAQVRKAYPDYENDNRSMNGAGKPAAGEAKGHLESGGEANSSGNAGAKPKRRR